MDPKPRKTEVQVYQTVSASKPRSRSPSASKAQQDESLDAAPKG